MSNFGKKKCGGGDKTITTLTKMFVIQFEILDKNKIFLRDNVNLIFDYISIYNKILRTKQFIVPIKMTTYNTNDE